MVLHSSKPWADKMPASKSQLRAMRLAGLAQVDTYTAAADMLKAAGYQHDGIPVGGTWRSAAKIEDAALMAAITLRAATGDEAIEW